MISVEILRQRNIATGLIPLHFSKNAPHVVFGMSQMHQLPLIWGFEDRVSHLFTMGQQAKATVALG